MNSESYCAFLETKFPPRINNQIEDEKNNLVFPGKARAGLTLKEIIGSTLMEWSPHSPDLDPTENLVSVLAQEQIYLNGMQFDSKDNL